MSDFEEVEDGNERMFNIKIICEDVVDFVNDESTIFYCDSLGSIYAFDINATIEYFIGIVLNSVKLFFDEYYNIVILNREGKLWVGCRCENYKRIVNINKSKMITLSDYHIYDIHMRKVCFICIFENYIQFFDLVGEIFECFNWIYDDIIRVCSVKLFDKIYTHKCYIFCTDKIYCLDLSKKNNITLHKLEDFNNGNIINIYSTKKKIFMTSTDGCLYCSIDSLKFYKINLNINV